MDKNTTDLWRLFFRFLLWLIEDFDIFRSFEDNSSESAVKTKTNKGIKSQGKGSWHFGYKNKNKLELLIIITIILQS